ncbi:DUF4430 domain-containing protein [Gracilibacillus xinjiangensis]|uniref:DUF4430 domain-containing protein n=1 Tax=Gracilibacillus xinjiangensis TaxID=1193282 RepID=A0ABV8WXJ0_9BACI
MKRIYTGILCSFITLLMLTGCFTTESQEEQDSVNEESLTIVISVENEDVSVNKIEIDDTVNLMDLLVNNFEVEADQGMITSIEGYEQEPDEGKYWLFEVNGEMATVGASDYKVTPGDQVVFNLGVVTE